jgi:hypothetical protein
MGSKFGAVECRNGQIRRLFIDMVSLELSYRLQYGALDDIFRSWVYRKPSKNLTWKL